MHSPPSSPLFMSSPLHRDGSGPQEEVECLLATALKVEALDPDLAAVVESHRSVFLEVFGRQVQLLKSRSQAFEDAHITVYDKVLLLLTRNGNDLEHPAAVTWYCTEYLGWISDGSPDGNAQSIQQTLTISHDLSRGLRSPFPERLSQAKKVKDSVLHSTRKTSNASTLVHAEGSEHAPDLSIVKRDARFAHLWSVYKEAHAEYLALANRLDDNALEAAKFLRDTAENGVHYLKDKHPHSMLMKELSDTHDMAKMAVLNLNGGRKRKFDTETGDRSHRSQRSHHLPHTAAHNRANFATRKQTEEFRGKRNSRGRGPSGIPYGYSRPVDSYYPA